MSESRPVLSDPKAMRALAHPARLAMINRLSAVGSATATELAEVTGVTPSAASYHLRMLAKYGFVEDAPGRADGRERVWQNVEGGFSVGYEPDEPMEVRAAKEFLVDAIWRDADEMARRAIEQADRLPAEWRDAATMTHATLLVTAEEMRVLGERMNELLQPYGANVRRQEGVPEGARIVQSQVRIFLRPEMRTPGLPTEDHGAADGPTD
ncbi:metalloregulator ArsR/SmtB family transcription factor [Nonomuraea sp. NPDC050310]|uniref:ArsR/SmtB family transcription factor n=1 Tax=Nonomuraea sp. NPDC050310 TaxID=3154935 RepID=UPI0033D938A9